MPIDERGPRLHEQVIEMGRWVVTILAIVLAAGAAVVAGYMRWGMRAAQVEHLEERVQQTESEAATLRTEKQDLQQRLDQLGKEQERLAQENETLRKEHTTQQLVTGQGGELPERPPK